MKRILNAIKDYDKFDDRCDEINPKKQNAEMRETILAIKEVMEAKKLSALAAPQIRYRNRIVCLKFDDKQPITYVNPFITKVNGFTLSKESDISIPNKTFIVPRNVEVEVQYCTPLGQWMTQKMTGMTAFVMQRMINMLDGLLISDIGLEIDEEWDKATDEERAEVIKAYCESLDITMKDVQKDIEDSDGTLKKVYSAIKFTEGVNSGKVKLETVEENK